MRMASVEVLGQGVSFTIALAAITWMLYYVAKWIIRRRKYPNLPPGPAGYPLLGSANLMALHPVPFAGFTDLICKYGDVFSVRLGSTHCVILNRYEDIVDTFRVGRDDTDGRPNFKRFADLFGGDKNNGAASSHFAGSHVALLRSESRQEAREYRQRRMQLLQCAQGPLESSSVRSGDLCPLLEQCCHLRQLKPNRLSGTFPELVSELRRRVGQEANNVFGVEIDIKMLILQAAANIFDRYFCHTKKRFHYDHEAFTAYVDHFDQVFWEVNQSRVGDIIPWMYFTSWWHVYNVKKHARKVREFVANELISCEDEEDSLLHQIRPYLNGQDAAMDRNMALYALEDILGGSCAVGCIALRMIRDLARNPQSQAHVVQELETFTDDHPSYALSNGANLHWTRAAAAETIRHTCSPIVPHRATRDTTIRGYDIPKDTLIFANNHALNMSGAAWGDQPEKFNPMHHLVYSDCGNGKTELVYQKPLNHFPFSIGKRCCLGFKLVEGISVSILAAVCQNFELSLGSGRLETIPLGMLGLPLEPFPVVLRLRH